MRHKYLTTLCFFIYASSLSVFLFSTEVPCYELHNEMQALFLEIVPTRCNSGDTHAKLQVIEPLTRLIKGPVSIKKILNYTTYYHFSYDDHYNNKRLLVNSESFIENVENKNDVNYIALLAGYGTQRAAQQFVQNLEKKGIKAEVKKRVSTNSKEKRAWYQVVTQKYGNRSELADLVERLKREEHITNKVDIVEVT